MVVDKNNPFKAKISERYRLSKGSSQKETYHVVLDIAGSGIEYNVGDSIAIYAQHNPALVEKTLQAMKASGDEIVADKHGQSHVFRDYLLAKANITELNRKLLQEIAARQTDSAKKAKIEALFADGQKDALKAFLINYEIWDLLLENAEVSFTAQELVGLMMPMLPRFYSIASSQKAHPDEIHLTVAHLRYTTNQHERVGVCTHFLCELMPLFTAEVAIYVQPHHGFTVPEERERDMIMVGPGTGVAPFRAFMQERLHSSAEGRHWLFFGEWQRSADYFYEEFWQALSNLGKLRVDTAFSRDQEQKVYVQHRMLEQGQAIYEWLKAGALLYVCGDAQCMAKDVDAALHAIIEEHGGHSAAEAKDFVKKLRSEKRYLRDVY